MKTLRNINPLGYVDVPLIGREGPAVVEYDDDGVATGYSEAGTGCLVPGEEFECSEEHAAILLEQVDNYEDCTPGDGLDDLKVPELKKVAANKGVDLGDATKKADIIAAIRKA